MQIKTLKKYVITVFVSAMLFSNFATADFTVEDIRVEGATNIEVGTIFNYLPIKVGDSVDEKTISQSIKTLFATGFFRDVQISKDKNILIVKVFERPAIAVVEYSGNKDIADDQIESAMQMSGLQEGRIFSDLLVDRLVQLIEDQYFSRGRYSANVEAVITPLDLNRVSISLNIDEGRVARIKEINIIGNKSFSSRKLKRSMTLGQESWHSFVSQTGRFNNEELNSDLEKIRGFYLDRGFMSIGIDSDVMISQNKQDLFITINIQEGQKYKVGSVDVEGGGGFSRKDLLALISMPSGEPFSQKDLVSSRTSISEALADEGYAFTNINAIKTIDEKSQTVDFVFAVDPGPLVYVRDIHIKGNKATRSEVIRRELRQLESSVFSASKIRRSQERISRLGFFDNVNIDLEPVPGVIDQVDLAVSVVERSTGNFMFGAGYADSDGVFIIAEVNRGNLFGTGRELNIKAEVSKIDQTFDMEYNNPYHTPNGISRALFVKREKVDTEDSATADFSSETMAGGVRYKIPMSEYNALTLSAAIEDTQLNTITDTPAEYVSFINNHPDNLDFNITAAFSKDTRDSVFFPRSGFYRRILAEASLPGSDLEYYKLSLKGSWYRKIVGRLVLNIRGDVGYGDGYGDIDELPFFKNYYAGGSSTVRGFESRSLGPNSSKSGSEPLGGSIRTVGNIEIYAPIPGLEDSNDKRFSLFLDSGQVFDSDQNIELSDIRVSVGGGFQWFSPIGPIALTYAMPLNDEIGDDVKEVQFTLGTFVK